MTVSDRALPSADRCELCGYRSDGTFRDRLAHLRRSHPVYARGLLLRITAPVTFLVLTVALAALRAPQWTFLVAFAATFGMLFLGKQLSRAARRKAGTAPTLPLRRLIREGGLGFILIIPVVALLIVLLAKR